MTTREVVLDGGSPWGFRLHGGADQNQPLRISRVNPGSKAALRGIREGDFITSINNQSTKDISNAEAHALLRNSGDTLKLGLNEDGNGSPKRRQYKTVHQETHSETVKKSSITSYTVTSSKTVTQTEGGNDQKTTNVNGSTNRINGDPIDPTKVVSQRSALSSTCSSSSSTPSTYTSLTSPSGMADNARSRRKRARNNRRKARCCVNTAEIIAEEVAEECAKSPEEYRVESPKRVKSPEMKKPIKSRSLDDDDVKIQELSEVSESDDKSECKAIVSEAESDVEWEKPELLPSEEYVTEEAQLISPEEELTLRNFLEGLNLVNSPEDAFRQIREVSTVESIKARRARKRAALEQYFSPMVHNPRFLEVINEETSEPQSFTRHLKQGTPEPEIPPLPQIRPLRTRKEISNPTILVGTKIIDLPICSTVSSSEAEVVYLEDSSNSTTPDPKSDDDEKDTNDDMLSSANSSVPDLRECETVEETKQVKVSVKKNDILVSSSDSLTKEKKLIRNENPVSALTPPPTPDYETEKFPEDISRNVEIKSSRENIVASEIGELKSTSFSCAKSEPVPEEIGERKIQNEIPVAQNNAQAEVMKNIEVVKSGDVSSASKANVIKLDDLTPPVLMQPEPTKLEGIDKIETEISNIKTPVFDKKEAEESIITISIESDSTKLKDTDRIETKIDNIKTLSQDRNTKAKSIQIPISNKTEAKETLIPISIENSSTKVETKVNNINTQDRRSGAESIQVPVSAKTEAKETLMPISVEKSSKKLEEIDRIETKVTNINTQDRRPETESIGVPISAKMTAKETLIPISIENSSTKIETKVGNINTQDIKSESRSYQFPISVKIEAKETLIPISVEKNSTKLEEMDRIENKVSNVKSLSQDRTAEAKSIEVPLSGKIEAKETLIPISIENSSTIIETKIGKINTQDRKSERELIQVPIPARIEAKETLIPISCEKSFTKLNRTDRIETNVSKIKTSSQDRTAEAKSSQVPLSDRIEAKETLLPISVENSSTKIETKVINSKTQDRKSEAESIKAPISAKIEAKETLIPISVEKSFIKLDETDRIETKLGNIKTSSQDRTAEAKSVQVLFSDKTEAKEVLLPISSENSSTKIETEAGNINTQGRKFAAESIQVPISAEIEAKETLIPISVEKSSTKLDETDRIESRFSNIKTLSQDRADEAKSTQVLVSDKIEAKETLIPISIEKEMDRIETKVDNIKTLSKVIQVPVSVLKRINPFSQKKIESKFSKMENTTKGRNVLLFNSNKIGGKETVIPISIERDFSTSEKSKIGTPKIGDSKEMKILGLEQIETKVSNIKTELESNCLLFQNKRAVPKSIEIPVPDQKQTNQLDQTLSKFSSIEDSFRNKSNKIEGKEILIPISIEKDSTKLNESDKSSDGKLNLESENQKIEAKEFQSPISVKKELNKLDTKKNDFKSETLSLFEDHKVGPKETLIPITIEKDSAKLDESDKSSLDFTSLSHNKEYQIGIKKDLTKLEGKNIIESKMDNMNLNLKSDSSSLFQSKKIEPKLFQIPVSVEKEVSRISTTSSDSKSETLSLFESDKMRPKETSIPITVEKDSGPTDQEQKTSTKLEEENKQLKVESSQKEVIIPISIENSCKKLSENWKSETLSTLKSLTEEVLNSSTSKTTSPPIPPPRKRLPRRAETQEPLESPSKEVEKLCSTLRPPDGMFYSNVLSPSAPSRSPSLSSDSSRATSLCTAKYNPMDSSIAESPLTLRELCINFLMSQPFGADVLQELADVSSSIDQLTTTLMEEDPQPDEVTDEHSTFIYRTSYHDAVERQAKNEVEITAIEADVGNRLLAIIRDAEEPQTRKFSALPREMESARLQARDLAEWLELARKKSTSDWNLSKDENRNERFAHRRTSLPQNFYEVQMIYLQEKEREIQRELEVLEEEKRRLAAEIPPRKFREEDYHISKKGDFAESKKSRPVSMPVSTEFFRQQMYEEYMGKMAEREERKHQKVIKIKQVENVPAAKTPAGIGDEFMNKVKEKQKLGKLKTEEENGNGDKSEDESLIPKHLQEFMDIAQLSSENSSSTDGVWSPGQKLEARPEEPPKIQQRGESKDEPISPVWTPKSATSSPTVERKEFRPVKFESPVLSRKSYSRSEEQDFSDSSAKEPPWKAPETSSDTGVLLSSALEKRLPTSHSSPASGFSDFPVTRLPKAQNPTITLLQKAREGQLPKGALYIEQDQSHKRPQNDKPPIVGPGEILYKIKNEYTSESDSEKPRKMADLGPRRFEGIGPTTKDGMPLILRSEVKDANQSKWYKRMYDTIHKQKPHRDEYVTVRYKQRRGQYPYTSGYLSEPEPGAYDSDFTDYKYATLDRRRLARDKENDYVVSSTMPRSVPDKVGSSLIKHGHEPYKNQPGRIENYIPGHSSISEKEAKEWWDEVMDIFDGHLEQQKRVPQTKSFINQALKESGYESDSTLVFRRRDDTAQQLSPSEQKEAYKIIQKGGDIPLHGLRKPAPERPKEPEPPVPPPKGHHGVRNLQQESPRKYVENEVTIHYKTPVRQEIKEYLSEDELAHRQAEAMKKIYQEERRRKYLQVSKSLQELQDMNNRRHTDNFIPSQKSPIPLNRYDDFDDLSPPVKPRPRSPEPRLMARALYNFVGQTARELTFRKGDLIYVRRQVDKNWYEGELNAMVGLFPVNYVEIITYDTAKSTPRKSHEGQARAKYNFVAQTHLELSLAKGELVIITRRVDDNWFEGKIGGRKGIFPVSYVEVLIDPSDPPTPSTKPVAAPAAHSLLLNGSAGGKESMGSHSYTPNLSSNQLTSSYHAKPVQITGSYGSLARGGKSPVSQALHIETQAEPVPYRALYKYLPQNDDELELLEGDTVFVLEKCDDGWYVGSSDRTGAFGTFPGNYVEKI